MEKQTYYLLISQSERSESSQEMEQMKMTLNHTFSYYYNLNRVIDPLCMVSNIHAMELTALGSIIHGFH
jgi:hypothetical protein